MATSRKPQRSAFGALLEQHRRRAGLTQEQLAERAGVSVVTIGALERGVRRSPYVANAAALARALGLSPHEAKEFEEVAAAGRVRGASSRTVVAVEAARLPSEITSFVARDEDIAHLERLLDTFRIVTITGAGGIGKTRVALELAKKRLPLVSNRVWFCDLATASDAAGVVEILSATLAPGAVFDASFGHIASAVASTPCLLVFDNCEHIVEAAARAAVAILRVCSGARVLATSRQKLNVSGEAVFRLPSLAIPIGDGLDGVDDARRYSAVALFEERALATTGGFVLTETTIESVVAICRLVEGIPLAIELAAARVAVFGVKDLRARLERHFHVLGRNSATAPARQQTLEATIDWSYSLLNDLERLLLVRLTVFAGAWTIDMAEAICSDLPLDQLLVVDLVATLVDKSLIDVVDLSVEPPLLRVLRTTSSFVIAAVARPHETEAVVGRHVAHYVGRIERIGSTFDDAYDYAAFETTFTERNELRAAVERAIARNDTERASRIFATTPLWNIAGWHREEALFARSLLERIQPDDTQLRVLLLLRLENAARHLGDTAVAERSLEEARAGAVRCTDLRLRVMVFARYACFTEQGSFGTRALASLEAAEATFEELRRSGEPSLAAEAYVLETLSFRAIGCGETDIAETYARRVSAIYGKLGNTRSQRFYQLNLASVCFERGDVDQAIAIVKGVLATGRPDRIDALRESALARLCEYLITLDKAHECIEAAREATHFAKLYNQHALVALALQPVALALALQGEPRRALALAGFVRHSSARLNGSTAFPNDRTRSRLDECLKRIFDDDEFRRGIDAGGTLSEDEALRIAFGQRRIGAVRSEGRGT